MDKSQPPRLAAGRRIILVFAVSALAGIVLVGAALTYSIERAALAQCRTYLESRAGMLARQCESEIAEAQRDLEFMSKMPAFQQLPYVDRIDPAINGVPENVDVEKRQFLTQTLNRTERFSVLYVLRPNADIYMVEPFKLQPKLAKNNLADRPYYQEAVRTKGVVVSDSFIGNDGVLAVVILVPILAESGDVTGYLGGVFYLTRLSQLVSKERITPYDVGFMVDRKGYLIAHTDAGLLKEGVRERFVQHPLVSRFLAAQGGKTGADEGAVLFDEYVDSADGKPYLAAVVPLRSGWGLALLRDRDSVVGEVEPVIGGITGLAALLFLVVSGIGVAIARRIGKRWETAERALRASEADLRTTLASIGDGVISTDTQRRISRLNDAAAALTGWTDQEAVGRPLEEVFRIVNEQTREPAPDPVARALASGRIEGLANHSVLIARDGAERAIADSAAPIRDPAGDITGVVLVFRDVSEERRAEEALRETNEYLDNLFNYANAPIIVWDPQFRITRFNRAFESLTGRKADTVIGKPLELLFPPGLAESSMELIRKTLAGERWETVEIAILHLDGSVRTVLWNSATLFDPDGKTPVATIAQGQDITERKRAEEELRFRNAILSAQQEASIDGILVVDENGGIISCNGRFVDMWGIPLEISESKSDERALQFVMENLTNPEEFISKVKHLYEVRHETSRDEIALKDGRTFDCYSAPMLDAGGKYYGRVWNFRDITDRKRAEQTQARLVAILDATPDFVGFADAKDTHVLYINRAGRNMTGVGAQEDVTRLKIADVHPEWTNRLFRDEIIPAAIRDGVWTGECAFLNRDGREVPVMMVLLAHKSPSGEVERFSTISRDITDRKRAEEALRAKTVELEQANSRLEAAIERANQMALEAQAANIAKGEFLANMSHEIRTPMNGVIGMTGLLLDTDLTEEQRRYAEVVRSSGEALLRVINDILDFSKIEADKLELEALDFDLRAMMEDTAELLAVRAHEKNLEFICRIDPEMPTFLRGDPGRLRQILFNLGGNAIKFTSRGEVAIEARLESETDSRIKARFEVRDTGIGIPQDKIGLLFTAFQQVDASTTRRFGGTGLGLAVSKRLVEMMGGEVGIESVEGRGSSFWFTAVLDKQPPRERVEAAPRADVRGARVLIVDDNATNRLVLAEQLASWGVRHAEAGSGAKAMDVLRAARAEGDPFRIVLTDMQMPEMDGESLGRAVKADPELRDTLLVMMASLGKRGDAKRLEAVGFSAYLTKPVKRSQLYDCLATVLGGVPPVKTPETALVTRHTLSEDRRRKVRILLAEDNPTNQQVALRILEKMGFRADAVANGQEAIQALKMAPYDIVFMDVQMPVMDGFEATRQIRNPQSPIPNHKVPIIAMTAHAMKGDRERCLEAGMDDYVPKPISPQALASAIENWLDRAQEQPPAVPPPVGETQLSEGPPVFDRQALKDRLMGDDELVKEIIAGFLEDVPKQIRRLREHVGQGQAGLAGSQAHTIKGAAANVGGMALGAVASAVEKAGNKGRLEEIAALMPELERQFDRLKEAMEKEI